MMTQYTITNKESAEQFVRNFWKKEDPKLTTALMEMSKREFSKSRPFHTFYEEGNVEGYDYLVCPLLGFRRSRLDARYTKSIGFTNHEDFKTMYPDLPAYAPAAVEKTNESLMRVGEGGLTGRQVGAAKTKVVRSAVNPLTGKSNYQVTGEKTSAGLSKPGRYNLSPAQLSAIDNRKSQHKTTGSGELVGTKAKYIEFTRWLTRYNREYLIGDLPTGTNGTYGAYQVDHKYPVSKGYEDEISPFVIANINNLQVLTHEKTQVKASTAL